MLIAVPTSGTYAIGCQLDKALDCRLISQRTESAHVVRLLQQMQLWLRPAENDFRMRSTWIWFGLSALCLILGLLLVLVFTLFFIVPVTSSTAVISTQCYVESVSWHDKVTTAVHTPGPVLEEYESNRTDDSIGYNQGNQSCPVVTVTYTLYDGQRRQGMLYRNDGMWLSGSKVSLMFTLYFMHISSWSDKGSILWGSHSGC